MLERQEPSFRSRSLPDGTVSYYWTHRGVDPVHHDRSRRWSCLVEVVPSRLARYLTEVQTEVGPRSPLRSIHWYDSCVSRLTFGRSTGIACFHAVVHASAVCCFSTRLCSVSCHGGCPCANQVDILSPVTSVACGAGWRGLVCFARRPGS